MKTFLWIIVSTFSYIAAFYAIIIFAPLSNSYARIESLNAVNSLQGIVLIAQGSIGAFLMVLGYRYLLFSITTSQHILLTIIGGLLSLSWYIIPDGIFLGGLSKAWLLPQEKFLGLFVFWQMGMAGALGWVIDKAGKRKI